ncbi:hypothetical protein [Cohnella rhizosphaerae]|uniref:Uncharacterized protein n=1 Tax=Cohnella rhizosphaerae TaxID=1457232 RepID=A0A9X4KZK3_9BACL|nr:hypothetical protein [Cohnella rhizosphaerae]MDG0813443.1 hypothetical protein [Cohnella rhizosphaerae]
MSYAQAAIAYLERELQPEDADSSGVSPGESGNRASTTGMMPAPLNDKHWGRVSQLSFADVATEGPWTIRRSSRSVWIDRMLATSAVGAKLSFAFEGTGLALAFDFGKRSADFRYRINGGEPAVHVFDRQDWCPDEGMFQLAVVAGDLPSGKHHAELEVVHGDGPGCTGTRFKLAFIGVIQESR